MSKIKVIFLIFTFVLVIGKSQGDDNELINPMQSVTAAGITAYSSMMSNVPAALARSFISGSTHAKGIIGESIVGKSYLASLQKTGNWHSISPRIGPNGIDHIFLKIDPQTGFPEDLIVGETKYGTSQLGETADGLQFTSHWKNARLRAMGKRYIQLSKLTEIELQKPPPLGAKHEMKVILKNKEVCYWRSSSKDPWKFSGNQNELREAQKWSKACGQFLYNAGAGNFIYRSNLFQVVPKGKDIVLIVKDASRLDILQQADKLPEMQRIVLKDFLDKKLSMDVVREYAKYLKSKLPGFSDKELIRLVKNIKSTVKALNQYTKNDMYLGFAGNAGIASGVAVSVDFILQFISGDNINIKKLLVDGGIVFLGTFGTQFLEEELIQSAFARSLFQRMGQVLGCSTSSVGSIFSATAGGLFVGLLIPYASLMMGDIDLETANRSALTSVVGVVFYNAAYLGTDAVLALMGSSSLGGPITVGVALIFAAVAVPVMDIVYELIDRKREFARITRLCELMLQPTAIEDMMRNAPISAQGALLVQ